MRHFEVSKKILPFTGAILLGLALIDIAIIYLQKYEHLWTWYEKVKEYLARLEEWVMALPQKELFVVAIVLLFAVRVFIPVYATSTLCFVSGLVLPYYQAFIVNIIGFAVMSTIKYFWGFRFGGGWAWKLVSKDKKLKKTVTLSNGKGNPIVLAASRLIPGMPVNTFSSIYGSLNYGYFKFLLISVVTFFPRLASFTIVGRNAFDPLSRSFLVPLLIILIFSGICLAFYAGVSAFVERIIVRYRKRKKIDVAEGEAI